MRHRGRDAIHQGKAMTRDELIELISDVTAMLGTALAQHVELTESISTQQGAGVESQRLKLDALKSRVADEKLKLAKLKDAAMRKRELEKLNRRGAWHPANESKSTPSMLSLHDQRGRLIGYIQQAGSNRINILDRKGRVVARQWDKKTFTGSGAFAGRGNQGLRLLGQRM